MTLYLTVSHKQTNLTTRPMYMRVVALGLVLRCPIYRVLLKLHATGTSLCPYITTSCHWLLKETWKLSYGRRPLDPNSATGDYVRLTPGGSHFGAPPPGIYLV